MKLNIKDNTEIDKIISNLDEVANENIRKEVERLAELKRTNPIYKAISGYEPDHFTGLACEFLCESDSGFQVMVHEFLWDVLTIRVTREYAINIWRNKQSYDEVA
nr:hypothetical protein [Pantoea sp. 201603H]